MDKKKVTLGEIVDFPIDGFKKSIVDEKVSIGVINNLIHVMSESYYDLVHRKDAVLDMMKKGKVSKKEAQLTIQGIYVELTKLEQKIVYLRERSKELLDTTS